MNNSNTNKPVLAITISALYLTVVILSFIIMLISADDTAMSGIFLVLTTIPWPFLLTQIQNIFHVDSPLLNGIFLLAGGTLNALILYKLIVWATSRKKL
jgi:hypothetical protein